MTTLLDVSPTAAPASTPTEPTPLAVNAKLLAPLLAVSVRTVRLWDTLGRIPRPIRIGGCVRWVLDGPTGIRAWLAAGAPDRRTWEAMTGNGRAAR